MSDTPRTDAFEDALDEDHSFHNGHAWRPFARQLEREIQELNIRLIDRTKAYELREREMLSKIRRLEGNQ